jgi:hypothetical protein
MAHWEKRLAIANPLRRRPEVARGAGEVDCIAVLPVTRGSNVVSSPSRNRWSVSVRSTSCRPSVRSLVPSLSRRIVDPQTWLGQMFFDVPIGEGIWQIPTANGTAHRMLSGSK